MTDRLFRDRRDAGQVLAGLLDRYRGRDDVVVLGLPRGGVPVAHEIATRLGVALDMFVVRKLGVPGQPELAMGAIASGDVVVLDEDVVRGLSLYPETIRQVAEREGRELLSREWIYRESRPMADVTGRTVILADDGLATGTSMRAAIQALRRLGPAHIVVALPAAPRSACEELRLEVDKVVCATTPSPFFAVGASYWDFTQPTDDEVRELLRPHSPLKPVERVVPEVALLRGAAVPVDDGAPADDVLFDLVGDARFVLIGEASHGTHEFYAARARMTRRLIEEKGFHAVAVEADWPDAYRVNRYVRGHGADTTAEESLRGFERFPAWRWRNADVLDFVAWLREHNDRAGDDRAKAGFYGLDLYSLHRSAGEVIAYLETVDAAAAARARQRYACFDHSDADGAGQAYGMAAAFGAGEACAEVAVEQLADLRRHAMDYASRDGLVAGDELFHAEQNARLVRDAEHYYRAMFGDRVSSWNLRDQHMAETLNALADHVGRRRGIPARIVVWAHNSHLGDARATEMSAHGERNVGQLVREQHGDLARLIGFTTFAGTVTAADDWGTPADRKDVRPALPGSVEELCHEVGQKEFMVTFRGAPETAEALRSARLERAIGVIYRPRTERQSHYFRSRVADQFDALIHIDGTRAVVPLERTSRWDAGEAPETYPHAV